MNPHKTEDHLFHHHRDLGPSLQIIQSQPSILPPDKPPSPPSPSRKSSSSVHPLLRNRPVTPPQTTTMRERPIPPPPQPLPQPTTRPMLLVKLPIGP
ncbi:hypothetical protein SLE2022_178550 [Rubroshorea leprosula]